MFSDLPHRSKKRAIAFVSQRPTIGVNVMYYILQEATHLTVSSGSATPVLVNVSHPASRLMNSGFGMSDPSASIAAFAACHFSAIYRSWGELDSLG